MADLPIRKSNRLKFYDYNENGAYFVTICVQDKQKLLGEVVETSTDDEVVAKNADKKIVGGAVPYALT